MSVKKRIIVTLLHDGKGQAVKPVSFSRDARPVGSLMQHVEVMAKRNIDELILLDIKATPEKRQQNWKLVADVTTSLMCPVTVGGGIRDKTDIRAALNNGADKVMLRTVLDYTTIQNFAKYVGSQCLCAAIDLPPQYTTYDAALNISLMMTSMEKAGVGEFCVTDMSVDGTAKGFNIQLLSWLLPRRRVPVIAQGGCGSVEHMAQAFTIGADAVAASSMFLYQDITPKMCANKLKEKGIEVR